MVRYGEGFFTLARLRAAARRRSGSARSSPSRATATSSATRAPGTSTTSTTCASRCASTSTAEDFSTDPPRARPQLLPARLQHAARPLPRQRQRRLPRGDRRHDRALGHAGVPGQARPARQGARRLARTSACCSQQALEKVAFLPFGLLIDQWRWKVFSGEITPADYNKAWWELRLKYQGVAPPVRAQRGRLRPGREVPRAGQRPVHALLPRRHPAVPVPPRAREDRRLHGAAPPLLDLREQGGGQAARTRCWRWGSRRPWPDALEALTGQRQMDATAILDYFAPLQKWLDEQNKGKPVGW